MIDDVRIGVGRARARRRSSAACRPTTRASASAACSTSSEVASAILALHEGREQPVVPGYEEFTYALAAHQEEAAR